MRTFRTIQTIQISCTWRKANWLKRFQHEILFGDFLLAWNKLTEGSCFLHVVLITFDNAFYSSHFQDNNTLVLFPQMDLCSAPACVPVLCPSSQGNLSLFWEHQWLLWRDTLIWAFSYSVDISGSCFFEAREVLKHWLLEKQVTVSGFWDPIFSSFQTASASFWCCVVDEMIGPNLPLPASTPLSQTRCGKNISPPLTLISVIDLVLTNDMWM